VVSRALERAPHGEDGAVVATNRNARRGETHIFTVAHGSGPAYDARSFTRCSMRRSLMPLLLSSVVLGACQAAPSVSVDREPVINGTRETGYPEVVAIYWTDGSSGGGLCSGTVIGPHAILTAKHCVFQETTPAVAVPNDWFYVLQGDDINHPLGVVHSVMEVRTTPGSDVNADVMNGADIAIILVRDNLMIPPRATATSSPAPGTMMTVVGFGRTMTGTPSPTDAGLKYSGPMRVRIVREPQILANGTSWTCQGDSGGPLIDPSGAVAGITSFGFDSTCVNSNSVFTSVSAWQSLIHDALAWAPPCMPSPEVCNGLDDDCNMMVDDGITCTALGGACTMNSDCVSRRCAMVGGSMICTQQCIPDMPALAGCPASWHCQVQDCGRGQCAPGAPGAGADGDTCTQDTDCASGYCADLQGRHLCGQPCWPMGGSGCPSGESCDLVNATQCGGCVPDALAMGPHPIGGTCTTDADCASDHCAAGTCTQPCTMDSECPSAYHCGAGFCVIGERSGPGGACATSADCSTSAPTCVEGLCAATCTAGGSECASMPDFACTAAAGGMYCLPPGLGLGATCAANSDCRSNLCGGVCAILCGSGVSCPTGYECDPAGGTNMACFPNGYLHPATSSGGCGCAVPGASGERGLGALMLAGLLGLFGIARRRRR
jgi:MYXO-CTERM domain-containing protein